MLAFRLILLLLLAYLVFVILWFFFSSRTKRLNRSEEDRPNQEHELVRCLHCQNYAPKAGGLISRGRYFCSERCARLFVKAP
jgi:hypothetical protein